MERTLVATGPAALNTSSHTVCFNEELLLRSLSFCGVEKVAISLQSKSGTVLGEASVPLRAALPQPLGSHALACSAGSGTWRPPAARRSDGLGAAVAGVDPASMEASLELALRGAGALSTAATAAATAAVATPPVEPSQWLPRQRILLRPPAGAGAEPCCAGPGGAGAAGEGAAAAPRRRPYVEVQMLQMVDGALPRLRGTHPLMLAVEQQQEQLVRAYLSLDIVDSLPLQEQTACVAAAIERRSHGILVQLLEHIRPTHQHLLAAVQARAPELVEALLQAGGAAVLHPRPRSRASDSPGARRGRGGLRGGRSGRSPSRGEVSGHGLGSPSFSGPQVAPSAPSSPAAAADALAARQRRPPRAPNLTPLAFACSLGDIPMVEALCQWARRERVHLDPTAPLTLGARSLHGPAGGRGVDGSPAAASASASSPWWEEDESQREQGGSFPCFGDPPMVMAVRGCGALATKLRLLALLSQYGFSADVRSPVDSWTPLLAAVELGCVELVEALVKLGARSSADRHLGFTPLHLTCQMGHWHLVPVLANAMQGQFGRVAAWGPSPQYVSLNLVDAYGRTALDVALLRYFSDPLHHGAGEGFCKPGNLGTERQKAVDKLREFVHRGSARRDAGLVCGWEILRVQRFLDALPSKKVMSSWGSDWDGSPPREALGEDDAERQRRRRKATPAGAEEQLCGDLEGLLQAVRTLVQVGAQTKKLPQDLLQPPAAQRAAATGSEGHAASGSGVKEGSAAALIAARLRPERGPKYSPIEPEDAPESSADEATAL